MTFQFHENRKIYFDHQRLTTQKYIIPFIQKFIPINSKMEVLEIGCAEAGVLKAFMDQGCTATGVDLSTRKLDIATELLSREVENGKLTLINKNIYSDEFREQFKGKFNLIILKDVIEHIPEQHKLIGFLKTYLKPNGTIFFSFPPWQMPFGGHQQMCKSKVLSLMPYFHLLPMNLYRLILKLFGEPDPKIKSLTDTKSTGISIERFEKIIKSSNYKLLQKKLFLINPIYEYKFKLKPKEQYRFVAAIPYLKNFITTCAYYLVQP